jgi:chorismate dehydratase
MNQAKKKAGLVKHINARPLTYGIEINPNFESIFEEPGFLKDKLIENQLDFALISSVECFRNKDQLNYFPLVGVAAKNHVRSILFFQNQNDSKPGEIFVDQGSRSSVALLKVLFQLQYGYTPKMVPLPASRIQSQVLQGIGSNLMFGDTALSIQDKHHSDFIPVDLSYWWRETTGKPFVYAFWAFPKSSNFDDSLFLSSLEVGLKNLHSIISSYSGSMTEEELRMYFHKDLHFILDEEDRSGYSLFCDYIQKFNL